MEINVSIPKILVSFDKYFRSFFTPVSNFCLMKKIITLSFLLLLFMGGWSQATFVLQSIPEDTPVGENIFVAGSFNSWNPGDEAYQLTRNSDSLWSIVMPQQTEGTTISFKFTRGDWNRVEKGANGEEIPDRQFVFGNGSTTYFVIAQWADLGGGGGGSTAAANVQVLDNGFYMPQLDRNRRIWIYLPPNYDVSDDRYPVLYMHDGQNLFDATTSYVGEWEVDETLNGLSDLGFRVPIVVGIDHGGTERINEYLPWINNQYGGGLGDEYVDFLVQTLKPYIDENFRTLPDRENTGVMGSSMGGLISQYAALKFQDVFSKAGIFSPAYWISDSVWVFTSGVQKQEPMRIYQLMGGAEGDEYTQGMWNMNDSLAVMGFGENELVSKEIPGGTHSESFWRDQFADAYLWLFDTYVNDVSEHSTTQLIQIYPNPVGDYLELSNLGSDKLDTLEVVDMKGVSVLKKNNVIAKKIQVTQLGSGNYILILHVAERVYRGKFVKL